MSARTLERPPRTARKQLTPRVRLSCGASGNWTLSGPNRGCGEFADFNAALRIARELPGSKEATIEVWQGGEYICCLPPAAWPPDNLPQATGERPSQVRPISAIDRYANAAARILMPAASMLFWSALIGLALAASLGWRLTLL